MSMETVIRSNTKGMREIVTKLETTVKEKNKEIEEMKKMSDKIIVKNEKLLKEIALKFCLFIWSFFSSKSLTTVRVLS